MSELANNSFLRIGYLMQNGAPDLNTLSGPQLHTVSVINGLRKLGHHVRVVAIQDGKLVWSDDLQDWFPARFGLSQARGFRFFESGLRRVQSELCLPFIGLFDSFRFADACVQLLRDFDILYERHGYMGYGGAIAAHRLGIPLIIELNGNIIKEIDELGVEMSSIQRNTGMWLTHRTLLTANQIVVVADALKEQLAVNAGVSEEKISVVLNGVNVKLFSQLFDGERIRDQFDIAVGPIVTFVGSFQPWHGLNLLLSSFRLVQSRFPNSQLILVGDGEGRDSIVNEIGELGLSKDVRLLGCLSQEEVAAVLSISDVAVAPYPYKHADITGTPLKILEYMAAGKAIVASTAPIHDIITDGETGLRVKPADAEALSLGISKLFENKELGAQLGNNARCIAINKYSWDKALEKIFGIMRDQLAQSSKAQVNFVK